MIDHISLAVSDIEQARRLYDACLAALGCVRVADVEVPDAAMSGYGPAAGQHPEPAFWIGSALVPVTLSPLREGQHLAFRASSRTAVDDWHAAALAHGAADNGAPGLRPDYHANYYAAFAIDPDGNRIEAVCHDPA